MLAMPELREIMKICIQGMDIFTTTQIKEILKERGYIYNVHYDVTAFSNAISSLTRQKYIVSLDDEKKGNYKVVNKIEYDNKKNEENEMKKNENGKYDDEIELKEMRENIKKFLKESCLKVEQILDSEKPSTYGRNRKTYDDILRLIEVLKEFEFTVEE